MLFKVVTLLSVIFLLGGLGICEAEPEDQHDAILQILQTMLRVREGSDRKDGDELNKVLVELVETVSQRIGSMSHDDGSKMLERLLELLRPQEDKPREHITERERLILMKVKEYLHPEMMKDLIELVEHPTGTFHTIIMKIIDRLKDKAKQAVRDMYRDYLMSTILPEEEKEHETCEKESCKKMDYEIKTSPFLKIMKLEGWKFLFEKEYDHKRFAGMVKYIEESSGPMSWLNHLFMATEENKWIWTVGHQILYMLEKNHEVREKFKHFIGEHKDLREIMVKASKWVESKDFNMSSPGVKRVVYLIKKMGFAAYDNSTKKYWLDEYMDWVGCNFGKQEEMAALLKSVGVMLKNRDPMKHFLHMLDFDKSDMINVTMQLMFGSTIRCNVTIPITQQKLGNVLYVVMGNTEFCTYKTYNHLTRKSTVDGKNGEFLQMIADITNRGSNMWIIHVFDRYGTLLKKDVDLDYIPNNGEILYFDYMAIQASK